MSEQNDSLNDPLKVTQFEYEFPFEVDVEFVDGVGVMEITSGPWTGIKYSYGRVAFPEDDSPVLEFNYDIRGEKKPDDYPVFEQAVGDFLVATITKMVNNKEHILFTGGA